MKASTFKKLCKDITTTNISYKNEVIKVKFATGLKVYISIDNEYEYHFLKFETKKQRKKRLSKLKGSTKTLFNELRDLAPDMLNSLNKKYNYKPAIGSSVFPKDYILK